MCINSQRQRQPPTLSSRSGRGRVGRWGWVACGCMLVGRWFHSAAPLARKATKQTGVAPLWRVEFTCWLSPRSPVSFRPEFRLLGGLMRVSILMVSFPPCPPSRFLSAIPSFELCLFCRRPAQPGGRKPWPACTRFSTNNTAMSWIGPSKTPSGQTWLWKHVPKSPTACRRQTSPLIDTSQGSTRTTPFSTIPP